MTLKEISLKQQTERLFDLPVTREEPLIRELAGIVWKVIDKQEKLESRIKELEKPLHGYKVVYDPIFRNDELAEK